MAWRKAEPRSCRVFSAAVVHYHFAFTFLTESETKEYALDNIKGDKSVVEKLMLISRFHNITYDMLTAIITELNNGYGLKETIDDLNIDVSRSSKYYDVELVVDGIPLVGNYWFGAQSTEKNIVYLQFNSSTVLSVEFDENNIMLDHDTNIMYIPPSDIENIKFIREFGKFTFENPLVFTNIRSNKNGRVEAALSHSKAMPIAVTVDRLIFRPHEFSISNSMVDCLL